MSRELEEYVDTARNNGVSEDLISKAFVPEIKSIIEEMIIKPYRDNHRVLMKVIVEEIRTKVDLCEWNEGFLERYQMTWSRNFCSCDRCPINAKNRPRITVPERMIDAAYFHLLSNSTDERKIHAGKHSYKYFYSNVTGRFVVWRDYKYNEKHDYVNVSQKDIYDEAIKVGIPIDLSFYHPKGCSFGTCTWPCEHFRLKLQAGPKTPETGALHFNI